MRDLTSQHPPLVQIRVNLLHGFFGRDLGAVDADFGILRRFVRESMPVKFLSSPLRAFL